VRIGELARQAGISVQSVRFYERRGLLPTPPRSAGGYRQYKDSDLEIVRTIKRLQQFDCTLAEVRRVLELYALPTVGGTPHPRGCDDCLVEAAELAKQKLKALDEKIDVLVAIRRDLMKLLREMQAKLQPGNPSSSTRKTRAKSAAS